jgi:cyclopropane-fatty-acyl-phospholipid synthase
MTAPVPPPGRDRSRKQLSGEASFLREYIFPVGGFAHLHEVIRPLEAAGFEVADVENITDHYTRTLEHWLKNLSAHANDLGAGTGVAPERFRAQLLFLAGSVESFSEGRVLCYQTLARPIVPDEPRIPLPPTRARFLLSAR